MSSRGRVRTTIGEWARKDANAWATCGSAMSNRLTGRNARRARFPCTEISWKRLRSSTVVQSVDGGCRSSTAVHVTRYVGCWVPRTGTLSLAFASDEVTYSQRGSTQDHVSERLQF